MPQETKDGIPLRFKGIVIYRVVKPEVAAALFDFSGESFSGEKGTAAMSALLKHNSLGELRDLVSRMTMTECIEQRKTTLTGVIREALEKLVQGADGGWGISIEVVQVAQVFIVDEDLRSQLEAETRNEIRVRSERAELQAEETVQLAQIVSGRRIGEESLQTERQRAALEEEKLALAASIERRKARESLETKRAKAEVESGKLALRIGAESEALDAEAPVRRRRHGLRIEELRERLAELELESEQSGLEVGRDFASKRAAHELEMEMVPLEQRPRIAEAASRVLNGTRLSVYGEDSRLVAAIEPLLESLGESLRGMGSVRLPDDAGRGSASAPTAKGAKKERP